MNLSQVDIELLGRLIVMPLSVNELSPDGMASAGRLSASGMVTIGRRPTDIFGNTRPMVDSTPQGRLLWSDIKRVGGPAAVNVRILTPQSWEL